MIVEATKYMKSEPVSLRSRDKGRFTSYSGGSILTGGHEYGKVYISPDTQQTRGTEESDRSIQRVIIEGQTTAHCFVLHTTCPSR